MGRIIFQIVYFVTFLTLFVLVLLSVYGYSYDFTTKEITRLGVIGMTSSNVASATVSLDTERTLPDAYLPLAIHDVPVGMRTVSVQKEGYMPWEATIEVDEYYVTEIGNVVLKPSVMEGMTQAFPEEVDSCFFPEQEGYAVVCIEEEKKLAYVLQITSKRNISTYILEIETAGLERIHWIDKDRLLFAFAESLPLVYRFSTRQWEPLPLPAEKLDLLTQGIWKEQYIFIHRIAPEEGEARLEKVHMLTGVTEATSDIEVEEVVLDQGKLWVREEKFWKRLDERILIPRDPPLVVLPSQMADWNDRDTMVTGMYTNELHEVVYRDPKTEKGRSIGRFSERVLGAAQAVHQEYWHIWTANDHYYCHEERSEPCIHLGAYQENSYWDKSNHLLYALRGRTLTIMDLTLDIGNERFAPVQLIP